MVSEVVSEVGPVLYVVCFLVGIRVVLGVGRARGPVLSVVCFLLGVEVVLELWVLCCPFFVSWWE